MKPTKSIYILLSLFLIFSCDDNSVEPLDCDEGLTNIDGVCQLCSEGLTEIDGKCIYLCEEGDTDCYYQGDLDVLQDIIDVNESLSGEPLGIGVQVWNDGKLTGLYLSSYQLTTLPESIGNLSSLTSLRLDYNQLTSIPESFCNLTIDWGGENESGFDYFNISNNQLCSSIPTCIVDDVGEQDCDD